MAVSAAWAGWMAGWLTYCLISSDDLSLRILLPISRRQRRVETGKITAHKKEGKQQRNETQTTWREGESDKHATPGVAAGGGVDGSVWQYLSVTASKHRLLADCRTRHGKLTALTRGMHV